MGDPVDLPNVPFRDAYGDYNQVSADFFAAFNASIVNGRAFTPPDCDWLGGSRRHNSRSPHHTA